MIDLEGEVNRAFETGDPSTAYAAALRVVAAYGDLSTEFSKLRFQVNFGTALCENCEGLRAGPGVVATCYQLRRCEFSNFREGQTNPKQARVIEALMGDPKSS